MIYQIKASLHDRDPSLMRCIKENNLDLAIQYEIKHLNHRLQKKKEKENKGFFFSFLVEEKDRPVPRKGLWGHYTSSR
jgi:hypothetical protein